MKILAVDNIRKADAYTIQNEPISSIDLMERAGSNCTKWIRKKLNKKQAIYIFVGPGNNGGDGLVIARQLLEKSYNVYLVLLLISENFTNDFNINLQRIEKMEGFSKIEVRDKKDLPKISDNSLIIDAIFGSGLSRAVSGLVGDTIKHINNNNAITISIDIPSGLFADVYTDPKKGSIVQADYTLSLQFPKYSFLFSESEFYIGQVIIIPIGLHPDYINSPIERALLVDHKIAGSILRGRSKFSHKGSFGHALLIAGSQGKMGAAILAARACLRSGIGLLTAHIPKSSISIIQTSVPECMLSIDDNNECFSQLPNLDSYNAIGIGPGLGTDKQSQNTLKLLIQEFNAPMVFDADALNILSKNKTWLHFLPAGSILTPHPKEFDRLVGRSPNSFERAKKQHDFATKHQVFVVLKGAHTCIATPMGELYFNSSGNPGMATAGSGDVLTGIILSLLAQGYPAKESTILGVYLHGLAGDIAAKKMGFEALIATDIVNYLGKGFKDIAGL